MRLVFEQHSVKKDHMKI